MKIKTNYRSRQMRPTFSVRSNLSLVVLCSAVCLVLATGGGEKKSISVSTSLGTIIGTASDDDGGMVETYSGIQYAKVGERFSRSTVISEPFEGGEYDATSFGSSCWQESDDDDATFDEECLYLNIWRPANPNVDNEGPLTTMVWVHGGSLESGSGAEYDGATLALAEDVIVVTINYRLGVLGFLALDEKGTGGMNGFDDQINALKWINEHIESFGGTPSSITLFGESSGGDSVTVLSVSPLARGLFQRGITMSGPAGLGWRPLSPERGYEVTKATIEFLGADSVDLLKDWESFHAKDIFKFAPQFDYSASFPNFAEMIDSKYTVDGLVLPDRPHKMYEDPSNIHIIGLMVGGNSYDGTLTFYPVDFFPQIQPVIDDLEQALIDVFGTPSGSEIYNAYDPDLPPYVGFANATYASLINIEGDYQVLCPSRELAAVASQNLIGGDVYMYTYAHYYVADHISGQDDVEVNLDGWASHSAEVNVLFGIDPCLSFGFACFDEDTIAMSHELMSRFASFAKRGDPNPFPKSMEDWTAITQSSEENDGAANIPMLVFREGSSSMFADTTYKASQCSNFLDSYRTNEDILVDAPPTLAFDGTIIMESDEEIHHGGKDSWLFAGNEIYAKQKNNGKLVVRSGKAGDSKLLWSSRPQIDEKGEFYTRLQKNCNLITRTGSDKSGDIVWKSETSAGPNNNCFFGLTKDMSQVQIWKGTAEDPKELLKSYKTKLS